MSNAPRYSYAQYGELSITTDEATYTCTTCGAVCFFTLLFGLLSNEHPGEFGKEGERAVWVIFLCLIIGGGFWSIFVVEPVVGIMQEDEKVVHPGDPSRDIPAELVRVGLLGGMARYMCLAFALLALATAIFGAVTNETGAAKETERVFYIIFFVAWGAFGLVIGAILINRFADRISDQAGDPNRRRP